MEKENLTLRGKTKNFVTSPIFIVTLISLSFLLYIIKQPATPVFYIAVLITLWAIKWDWKYFGITKPNWSKTITKALIFSICIFILSDFLFNPFLELYFGKVDLNEADQLIGNLNIYVLYLLLGWIFGGFCEEIIFRGYVVKRLAIILGDSKKTWLLSAIIASIGFGFMHYNQGPSGIILTCIIGFMLGLIFIYNRDNLMVPILTHGIYNMMAITLIYLGKARTITEWVQDFFN